ncbi:hypothetical protein [Neobacillus sp. YIM B06451]|uniref:hypothetical protein n=1 Tax=Neobacillus sp. YIM B06451 TaxID=3070994 RepID=UPI002931C623|nr:hypothetical protein [Neobacillus sp. YIM B06451]
MQVLFGLASLILLFPVLYFLPIGITGKGKLFLGFTAALFAIGAIYLSELVPPWQIALLIMAIAGGTSLIFARKFGAFLFHVPNRIDKLSFFQDEQEKSSHFVNKYEPLELTDVEVVPKDQSLAQPIKAELQDTETLAYLEPEEIAEIGLSQNTDAILPVLESDELVPFTPLANKNPEAKGETSFLDELGLYEDIEEVLEKSIPPSPFLDGPASAFDERDLEVLVETEDAELPVFDFGKRDQDDVQFEQQDDYLTALLESAATVEKEKAGGSRNG